jgi:hypothetical protein
VTARPAESQFIERVQPTVLRSAAAQAPGCGACAQRWRSGAALAGGAIGMDNAPRHRHIAASSSA